MLRNRISSIVLGLLMLMAGCASPKIPAKVTGSEITDPSLGFHGISLRLPSSYRPYAPLPKNEWGQNNAQWAWRNALGFDNGPGLTALEHIPFEGGDGIWGITVSIIRLGHPLPAQKTRLLALLDKNANRAKFSVGEIVTREVANIGGRDVLCIERVIPERARHNAIYIMPIMPSSLLVFNGFCPIGREGELITDIKSAISSVRN